MTIPREIGGLSSCRLASTVVSPATGGQLSASISGLDVDVKFPANAVLSPNTMTIEQVASPTFGGGFQILGKTFAIDGEETSTQSVIQLAEPFTVTIGYSNADLTGLDESKLDLYYWDSQRGDWVATDAVMDEELKTLTARSTQLGIYAVAVDEREPVFLPSVASK